MHLEANEVVLRVNVVQDRGDLHSVQRCLLSGFLPGLAIVCWLAPAECKIG